jgi:hypothetical protein
MPGAACRSGLSSAARYTARVASISRNRREPAPGPVRRRASQEEHPSAHLLGIPGFRSATSSATHHRTAAGALCQGAASRAVHMSDGL